MSLFHVPNANDRKWQENWFYFLGNQFLGELFDG
jgi:hypothetical protein